MARSQEYSRRRFYVMQIVMWVILAASVGVAALVSWDRKRSKVIELGEPSALGVSSVRLPKGWRVLRSDLDGGVEIQAVEPVSPPWQRVINVEEVEPTLIERVFVATSSRGKPITIDFGDARGAIYASRTDLHMDSMGEPDAVQIVVLASGVLPEGLHINIRVAAIELNAESRTECEALAKSIAATVKRVRRTPELDPR